MKNKNIKKVIAKLPDMPGVYFFVYKKKILYIGKATSLRDRVRSYFNTDIATTRSPLISKMLGQFDDIKFQKTDSVLEALILEANLIKKHQPEANIKEKDDRSFNYVVITDEDFPRVLIIRSRELEKSKNFSIKQIFGPFPNGSQLKEAIKIVRKMFPFRDKCMPGQGKPCFNRQIGLCPGVCTGEISQKEYAKTIQNIILFFESKKKTLIKRLEKQMKHFAKTREFEKAGKIKKTIFTLNHIQDVALIKDNQMSKGTFDTKFRIESYDIAHLSGTNMVGAMVVVENGEVKKSDYRKFKIKNVNLPAQAGVDDTKALSEILTRRLAHTEWPQADLIVVDGGIAQKRAMEKVLLRRQESEGRPEASAKVNGKNIPVVSVVKDERHRPKEIIGIERLKNLKIEKLEKQILLANAEAHRFAIGFHKQLRRKLL
jgi:excinuclease ABC subunit C